MMRHTQAEPQSASAHGLHRQRLLRQRDGVARLHRHHGGPDLDPLGLGTHHRRGGERVELVGDLWHPDGGESRVLGPTGVTTETVHLRRVAAPLGADHHSDAHGCSSVDSTPP